MRHLNWETFQTAYEELRRRGVSHDAASDRALYLAGRGRLPDVCNWFLIAKQCRINEAKRADNDRCVSLYTVLSHEGSGQSVVLGDVLEAPCAKSSPERIALARIQLCDVPERIRSLFTDRHPPLTNTEYSQIHRFRKSHRQNGYVR